MKTAGPRNIRGERLDRSTRNARIKDVNADFGTYHHSTPDESKAVRAQAEAVFSKLLLSLFPSGAHLRILDAGCGLGFLMYVAARSFPNSTITGVDLFNNNSVSELSLDHAIENMRVLKLDSRTSFLKHDLTKPLETEVQYDLAVSNVVFHNMGKRRFKAYQTVFDVLRPGGYFVLGDLFPKNEEDADYFRAYATLVHESDEGSSGRWAYRVKVLRKNE